MQLNDAGMIIEKWWLKLPEIFPSAHLDRYIIMPNHLHGIIILGEANREAFPNAPGEEGAPVGTGRAVSLPRSDGRTHGCARTSAHTSARAAVKDGSMVQNHDH